MATYQHDALFKQNTFQMENFLVRTESKGQRFTESLPHTMRQLEGAFDFYLTPPPAHPCVDPCHNGGTCTVTGDGTYSCSCVEGFEEDNCETGSLATSVNTAIMLTIIWALIALSHFYSILCLIFLLWARKRAQVNASHYFSSIWYVDKGGIILIVNSRRTYYYCTWIVDEKVSITVRAKIFFNEEKSAWFLSFSSRLEVGRMLQGVKEKGETATHKEIC